MGSEASAVTHSAVTFLSTGANWLITAYTLPTGLSDSLNKTPPPSLPPSLTLGDVAVCG